jgi:chromosome segregation ATPase
VAGLTSQCDDLSSQIKVLQTEKESLISNQKQQQPKVDAKELVAAKRELDNYAQSESKLLLELNRRLGLAKRCSELSQTALSLLCKCSEITLTPTTPVDDQPVAVASPAAVLSILGKYLDSFVLRMMDLKKISESLSSSVPAMQSDCERLMSKIVDLERMRAEWSEGQGELIQTKCALANQLKQQQTHSQAEAALLSILQSCGGTVQGEQLQQTAHRITEELKTARMTIAELARQVEVERSSSNSRNRSADSQGSELRASLVAAEQRHSTEISSLKSLLRASELQCQQASLQLQAAAKLNAELSEQVNVFESVLAEKDAEVAEVSQQLQLARALVTSLSDQAEVAVNLELVSLHTSSNPCIAMLFCA